MKLYFLFLAVFFGFILAQTPAYSGTWSHSTVKTLPNGGAIVAFVRSPSGETKDVYFSRIINDGTEQFNKKKFFLEVNYSELNRFDIGGDGGLAVEILIKLIISIRSNPDLTVTQAVNWYDTNYPDGLYSGIQLLKRFREYLTTELGFEPSWDQFKNYVINNTFARIDLYVP